MSSIVITKEDRVNAEAFLEAYLQQAMPDVDISRGSPERDILITGLAHIVAYVRAEITGVKQLTSIARLKNAAPSQDRDDAADDLVSNYFITRNSGGKTRGVATLLFSDAVDVNVPVSAVFYRGALEFKPDIAKNTLYPASTLTPVYTSKGALRGHILRLPVIAAEAGAEHNITAGNFTQFSRFSPYLVRAYAEHDFSGGTDVESTEGLLERAKTSLTMRNFSSARAIDATLKEAFGNIADVIIAGYGDAEMVRDTVDINGTKIHTGGKIDVYVNTTDSTEKSVELTVGSAFPDPAGTYRHLSDAEADFISAGVQVSDMLLLKNQPLGVTTQFIIDKVAPKYIEVSPEKPFDMSLGDTSVDYSIVSSAGNVLATGNGEIKSLIALPGSVLLPGEPVYNIRSVRILDPGETIVDSLGQPLADPDTNAIELTSRRFTETVTTPTDSEYSFWYRVYGEVPALTHSIRNQTVLNVGSAYDGLSLSVTYDTLESFNAIDAYVSDSARRNISADVLVKGMHRVYASPRVMYKLKASVPDISAFEDSLRTVIAEHIGSSVYPGGVTISDLTAEIHTKHPELDNVIPYAADEVDTGSGGQLKGSMFIPAQPLSVSPGTQNYLIVTSGETIHTHKIVKIATDGNAVLLNANYSTAITADSWILESRYPYTLEYTLHAPDGRLVTYRTDDVMVVSPEKIKAGALPDELLDVEGAPSSRLMTVTNRTIKPLANKDDIVLSYVG